MASIRCSCSNDARLIVYFLQSLRFSARRTYMAGRWYERPAEGAQELQDAYYSALACSSAGILKMYPSRAWRVVTESR